MSDYVGDKALHAALSLDCQAVKIEPKYDEDVGEFISYLDSASKDEELKTMIINSMKNVGLDTTEENCIRNLLFKLAYRFDNDCEQLRDFCLDFHKHISAKLYDDFIKHNPHFSRHRF